MCKFDSMQLCSHLQKDPPQPKSEPACIAPALNASSYYVRPFRGLPTLVRVLLPLPHLAGRAYAEGRHAPAALVCSIALPSLPYTKPLLRQVGVH